MALSNPEDEFHNSSLRFMDGLNGHRIGASIGPPFLLEVATAAERRGTRASVQLVETAEEHRIVLTSDLGDLLWSLSGEYASMRVLRTQRELDLLHYASATLMAPQRDS